MSLRASLRAPLLSRACEPDAAAPTLPSRSNALASTSLVPSPILSLYNLVGPLAARILPFGNLPETYADVPVYVAANPAARGQGLEYCNERLKSLGSPAWAEGATGKKVWDGLRAMIEQ